LRLSLPISLTIIVAVLGALAVGVARSAQAMRPAGAQLRTMRAVVDHYRVVTWTYERAVRRHVTPTSFSYRRTRDTGYLQWTLSRWQHHAYDAQAAALDALRRRLDLRLPHAPGLHASLYRRVSYAKSLTIRLRRIYPGTARRDLAGARAESGRKQLLYWQGRAAAAAYAVSRHATPLTLVGPRWLTSALLCIHHYEGGWSDNTGNGYYGGLQMDWTFMRHYGAGYLSRWGTADRWPPWAQLRAAARAYNSGRGFWPWPHTAAACGLL
jgi:hypothetical protein